MLGPRRRNRTRTACIPCQIRKRKCSGTQPCTTCAHLESDCHYDRIEQPSRPLRHSGSPTGSHSNIDNIRSSRSQATNQSDHNRHLSSVEANSGAAFARKLGLKIDPNLAPRLNMFAWNIGLRHSSSSPSSQFSTATTLSVVNIISHDEMRFLAAVYFEKVDPYYPFLDRDELFCQITQTWLPTSTESFTPYEGILCGVAALGSLFSQKEPNSTESQLLESARLILEHHLRSHTPSVNLITAWVLRVSYLRIAGTPHLAWVASCTLMHLIEAAGLHMELPASTILAEQLENTSLATRRKLFGIARHFNLWISFELGRTRVTFPTATTKLPDYSNGTKDIFSFLALSESLDPEQTQEIPTLEQALVDIINIDDLQPPMILTQCNLMLCIHRRLQSLSVGLSGELFDRFLSIARQGLRATRENVLSHSPWHQVANVPFQIVCALLAIDNHAAIDLLQEAIQTLREVATSYDTEVMREAHNTALLLIRLHHQQKEQDAKALTKIIQSEMPPSDAQTQFLALPPQPNSVEQSNNLWSDNAILNLQGFQLDPLLMMDGPWPATNFEL